MKIQNLVKDFFFREKVEALLKQIGGKSDGSSDSDFEIAILDLNEPSAWHFLQTHPEKCLCFYSHKDANILKRAQLGGCKHVYPRHYFFNHFKDILEKATQNV